MVGARGEGGHAHIGRCGCWAGAQGVVVAWQIITERNSVGRQMAPGAARRTRVAGPVEEA
jgi:hypothetical protein